MRIFEHISKDLKVIAPVGDHCGEGLIWVASEGALYWTDVCRFLVHKMVLSTGDVRTWFFDEPCVALSLTDKSGVLLLGIGSKLILWTPETDERVDHGFALNGWPKVRLNEGRAGPRGEFWVGSMGNNVAEDGDHVPLTANDGELFRITADGPPVRIRGDIGISNTLCFSPDNKYLYFGDTVRNLIWRYEYDAEARLIHNETVFFEGFERGKPDGSAIDCEGFIWNTRFGGGCLVRIAPNGKVDRVIEMPVSNLTTCDFGGPELKTLFITSATLLLERHERLAGSVFALETDIAGAPANLYHIKG
jgi:sugar lactone lactonase YvrE